MHRIKTCVDAWIGYKGTILRLILSCLLNFLLLVQFVYPQSGGCPCDYFTAGQDSNIAQNVRHVKNFHVDPAYKSMRNGRMNHAINDLKFTLDRFPNHPEALQLLGMVAQMTKGTSLAVSYFEKAITTFPQYALTRAQYGLFLVSIGNIDAGIEKLNESIEMDPKLAVAYAGLARAYFKKGDLKQAREAAEKARTLGFKGQLPAGL